MCPGGTAARSTVRNHLTSGDRIAFFYFEIREMQIQAHEPLAVIDDNKATFEVQFLSEQHGPGVDRPNGCPGAYRVVQSQVAAFDLAVEDPLRSKYSRNRGLHRGLEVVPPKLFRSSSRKNVSFYFLVSGDLFQLLRVGFGELLGHSNGNSRVVG